VQNLSRQGGYRIVTADLAALPQAIQSLSAEHIQGDLVNKVKLFYDYDFDIIFHLAASLSSKAKCLPRRPTALTWKHPAAAHAGIPSLRKVQKRSQVPVPQFHCGLWFLDLAAKQAAGCVKEDESNTPPHHVRL